MNKQDIVIEMKRIAAIKNNYGYDHPDNTRIRERLLELQKQKDALK